MQHSQAPREQRLVDIPTFKGGNQDPVEWIESFQRACQTNRIGEIRMMEIVGSYLKGTALTWFNSATIFYWNNANQQLVSFVPMFQQKFCSPFKQNQWKHQLRNRKQRAGETTEEYTAAMGELWKRIDPTNRRDELDRVSEFIEGLRAEFIVPVQSTMPTTVDEAVDKVRAVKTAFSIGMELSAYSLLPGYLQRMGGATLPAQANLALYQPVSYNPYMQPSYAAQSESIEEILSRKLNEGLNQAIANLNQNQLANTANNGRANNQGTNRAVGNCFNCGKSGHLIREY